METRAKRPSRGSGRAATPPAIPLPVEPPAEDAAFAPATAAVRASDPQPSVEQPPLPAEPPAEDAAFAPATATVRAFDPQPSPEQRVPPAAIGRLGREALAALADSQAAMMRGLSALSDEMAGLTRSGIDLAARAATEMLEVKTVSDAFRINAKFARNSFDSLLDGSTKLSGLGVKLAAESSRPILTQWGQGWIEVVRRAL